MSNYTKNARMELALADLNQQEYPNVLKTSKSYNLVESTLRRRWKGQTLSHEEASSEYKQRLTTAQEEVLIQRINQLANRGIPTTSRIVHNLAEEMVQGPIGKNWTGQFVERYNDRLKSLYLKNIDKPRVQAEYAPLFKLFFDLVFAAYPNSSNYCKIVNFFG